MTGISAAALALSNCSDLEQSLACISMKARGKFVLRLAWPAGFWVQIKPLYCPCSSDKGTNRVRVGWHFSWDQKCTSEAYLLISPTYCAFSCTAGQTIGIRLLGETNIGKVLQEDNSCAPARWHVGPDWKTQPHVQYGCEVLITSCRSAAVWLFSFLMQIQPSDTQNP